MTRQTGPTRDQREAVWIRASACCERCGRDIAGDLASIHHRKPRRMGGTKSADINSLSNLMLLCGSGTTGCHGWVESHRAVALEEGFLLHAEQDPAEVPVWMRHNLCVKLLPDGSYRLVATSL